MYACTSVGVTSIQGVHILADVNEVVKMEEEEKSSILHCGRSISPVEVYSPSLLDSSTSETKSLISPQAQEDAEGMSEVIFSPSLLNSRERVTCHSTQIDPTRGVIHSHSTDANLTDMSPTDLGSSDSSLCASPTQLESPLNQPPPTLGIPPSDTQYLMQSINTFPMSPEIGMGSRKNLTISLDENDCHFEDGRKKETIQSTDVGGTVVHLNLGSADSAEVDTSVGTKLLLKAEELASVSRTKRLALHKGKSTKRAKQKTLTQTYLKVGGNLVNLEPWEDECIVMGEEHTASREKCAGGGESSGTLTSSLAVWKTTTEEEPQPTNATSPKKITITPKTTSSPIAPKCRRVVTVVPQTPLPGTSPSSASKASPRGRSLMWKNRGRRAEPLQWDPEETYLPLSQLDCFGSRESVGEEFDLNGRKESGKSNIFSNSVAHEQMKFIQCSSSHLPTVSDDSSAKVQQTMAPTCASETVVATKRTCGEGECNSTINDACPPPAKKHAVEAQEDVDPAR